jgi:predicted CXXCH cytochrome family protein
MKMISLDTLRLSFLFTIITLILSMEPASCQEAPEPGELDSCITSECHSGINKNQHVHDPVNDGDCDVCHGSLEGHADDPARFQYEEIEDPGEVCYSCHEKFEKIHIHGPVESGECTTCHDPHGSRYKFQLIAEGRELCFNCHDEGLIDQEYRHGPADAGGCLVCHAPHASDYDKGLRKGPSALCYMCHTDKAAEFRTAKVVHRPAVENCAYCHNPHSAGKKYMLSYNIPELCFTCHKDKKEWIENAATRHGAMISGRSCLNCHDPHASNIAKRLSLAPLDLCLSCHNEEVITDSGDKLANIRKLLEENKYHHGPIREKDCSGCHNPHGSSEFRMLRESYPSTFYMEC